MRWDQDTRDDVDMALNEADVLGLRLEPSGAWCGVTCCCMSWPFMPADSKPEVPISPTISTGGS